MLALGISLLTQPYSLRLCTSQRPWFKCKPCTAEHVLFSTACLRLQDAHSWFLQVSKQYGNPSSFLKTRFIFLCSLPSSPIHAVHLPSTMLSMGTVHVILLLQIADTSSMTEDQSFTILPTQLLLPGPKQSVYFCMTFRIKISLLDSMSVVHHTFDSDLRKRNNVLFMSMLLVPDMTNVIANG